MKIFEAVASVLTDAALGPSLRCRNRPSARGVGAVCTNPPTIAGWREQCEPERLINSNTTIEAVSTPLNRSKVSS